MKPKPFIPPYPVAPRFRLPAVLITLLAAGLTLLCLLWLIWAR